MTLAKKKKLQILTKNSKTVFLFLLERTYETQNHVWFEQIVKVTLTQRVKEYLLICIELVTCHTVIWKATPVPENNNFVLKFMRNNLG